MERFLGVFKVMVLMVVVMSVSGCVFFDVYRKVDIMPMPTDSRPLVTKGKEIKVYVEPQRVKAHPEWIRRVYNKDDMSDYIVSALTTNNIAIGSSDNHNIAIKISEIKLGIASQGLRTTTTFLVNSYTVEIEAETYGPAIRNIAEFDFQNAYTVTGKILSKLIRNNIGGNHEIKAKVLQRDGKIVEWNDSTGL